MKWWLERDFGHKSLRQAAELLAVETLAPALRSRDKTPDDVKKAYEMSGLQTRMRALFSSEPTGHLQILNLQDALDKISALEHRPRDLQDRLEGAPSPWMGISRSRKAQVFQSRASPFESRAGHIFVPCVTRQPTGCS